MNITCVIASRNHNHTLKRAVFSAWAAGVDEVIVVDDGSDPVVPEGAYTLYRTSKTALPMGVCYARTKGILEAREHDLILPLDADDELIEDGVKALRRAYQPNSFVYGAHLEDGVTFPPTPAKMIGWRDLTGVTFLFSRADFIRAGGYPPDFNVGCEGWALQSGLVNAGVQPIPVNEPVYVYHRSDGGRMDRTRWLMPLIRQLFKYNYGTAYA